LKSLLKGKYSNNEFLSHILMILSKEMKFTSFYGFEHPNIAIFKLICPNQIRDFFEINIKYMKNMKSMKSIGVWGGFI